MDISPQCHLYKISVDFTMNIWYI